MTESDRPLPTATPKGYMPGFGNDFETEALPGALPVGRNSPNFSAASDQQLLRAHSHEM